MIVCKQCGHHNRDEDEFCANDGVFLAFSGVRVEEQDVPAPPVSTPPPAITRPPPRQPGELICGQCGWGNTATRHFCRHCGASLLDAVVQRAPWYRRLLPHRRPIPAGSRPRRLQRDRPPSRAARLLKASGRLLQTALPVLFVLGVLAYAALPPVRAAINQRVANVVTDLRRTIAPQATPVHPLQVAASADVPGHPAELVADTHGNTYWAADFIADHQPVLTLVFDHPVDLRRMAVTSGTADDFTSLSRPMRLHLVYSSGSSQDLTLKDDHAPQTFEVNGDAVTRLEIQITSVYRSAHTSVVALSEIELWTWS